MEQLRKGGLAVALQAVKGGLAVALQAVPYMENSRKIHRTVRKLEDMSLDTRMLQRKRWFRFSLLIWGYTTHKWRGVVLCAVSIPLDKVSRLC